MIRWILIGIAVVVAYQVVMASFDNVYVAATNRMEYNRSSNSLDRCIAISKKPDFLETLNHCQTFLKNASCKLLPESSPGCIAFLSAPSYQSDNNFCLNWSSQMTKCRRAVSDSLAYGPIMDALDSDFVKNLSKMTGYPLGSILGDLFSFHGVKVSDPWFKHIDQLDQDVVKNIYIATIGPANLELDFFRGVELASQRLNKNGGVRGHQVKLVRNIDDGTPGWNREKVNEIIRNKRIVAVINRQNSETTKPLTMLFENGGLLDFIVSASNVSIILPNMQYNFRTHPDNVQLSVALAKFCRDSGRKSMAMVTALDPYSKEVSHAFYNAALDVGIRIPYTKVFYGEQVDFTSIINDIKHKGVEALFLAGTRNSSVDFVKQCRRFGLTIPIYGSKTLENSDFVIRTGAAANGIVVPSIYNETLTHQENVDFIAAYRRQYGEAPTTWAMQGYDAMNIIARAIKNADSTEPLKVASVMRYKGMWSGAGGSFHFAEDGQVEGRQIFFKEIRNGDFVLVKNGDAAVVKN